jgi:signal transduction histidine kinase
MVDILDDLLTLGKVESGKLSFEPAHLDLAAFCENVVAEIEQAAGTDQHIHFTINGDCSTALMDAKLLRHILGNLLSNALKYSLEARSVTFAVYCKPDHTLFRVQDQGIGIPEEDQKRLFETFHRASNAKRIPGTGLGLAIVKQSVDLHGGTITFESEEGVGTTFTVTIPSVCLEDSPHKNDLDH